MRERKFIRSLFYLFVAIMVCGTAMADTLRAPGPWSGPRVPMAAPEAPAAAPFYSNLVVDPCTACNYDTVDGVFLIGPNNCFAPGVTQWLAYPFVSTKTGAVRRVSLAVTDSGQCVASSNKFTVAIYSDNCTGAPATQIGSAVIATAAAAPCALTNANFGPAGVSLTAGTKYWVVATTSTAPNQMGTTALWWGVNTALSSLNLNDGNGWQLFAAGTPGGFSVQ